MSCNLARVRDGTKMGVQSTYLAGLLDVTRAALHKHARRGHLATRHPATRTPDKAGWVLLVAAHGTDLAKLSQVTGLRRDWVREQLERHELVECEW